MKNFGIFKNRYNKHGPALHAQSNCIVIFQLLAFSKNRLTCLILHHWVSGYCSLVSGLLGFCRSGFRVSLVSGLLGFITNTSYEWCNKLIKTCTVRLSMQCRSMFIITVFENSKIFHEQPLHFHIFGISWISTFLLSGMLR